MALIATAVLLRALVAFALLGAMPMVSDARDYFALALRLAGGDDGGAFYWPPGESLLLAAGFSVLGPTIAVARALTIATSVGTLVFTVLLAGELAGDSVARAAGWIAAVYAPSVMLCGQAYAQHLAALCLAAIAYFGMRAMRERRVVFFAATGIALGLGCLARPSMASVVPVVAVAWGAVAYRAPAARRAMAAGAAAATVLALGCVVPVCAHNALAGGGFTVSTNNERNLFLGNNPYTPDYKTSHLGQRALDELPADARSYLESFYGRPDNRTAMQRAALAYMVGHPFRTSLRTFNRTTSFWGFDYLASREIQRWRGWGTRAALPLLAFEVTSYLAVAGLALIGLFAMPAAGGAGALAWRAWLVALAIAYQIPYALAFSGGTYHFPVIPLITPLAATVVAEPREAWRRMTGNRVAWVALAVFAAIEGQYAYYAVTMSG